MKQDEISDSDKTGCQIKKKGSNDEDEEFWSGKRDKYFSLNRLIQQGFSVHLVG
ncbi:hypothetical protein GT391_10030 [Pectobacterium brasiliense]|uniref:hypothetical protein n=1 Tax=Pectobacterium brasiliense TaxID=180957 RepID=UPI0001A446FC|nr:hypothetical protein [Pectobacterium brasiliense]MBN3188457.1 hypothetical protein [Pectobacterium brasiliense]QHG28369.1 hypothetical protein GT391_10030 [Pectobacterium brasiliense]